MDVPRPEALGRAAGRGQYFHLAQRMNQSLKLSQALHGTRSLEGVSSKLWQLLAARDLQKGGSIQAEMELLLGSAGKRRLSSKACSGGDQWPQTGDGHHGVGWYSGSGSLHL